MTYLYLHVDICAVTVPLLFSFHPKLKFYKEWPAFLPGLFITAIIFLVWDEIYTTKGIWGFNAKYITGIYLFHLPLEEVLFFLCIPYSCVFTYHSLGLFYQLQWSDSRLHTIALIISITLLLTGLLFYNRLYTSVTFISSSLLLFFLAFIGQATWLGKLMTVYLILLIPFFIVNGILTGTGLQQPVVWYNPSHITGLRLRTIPFEDIFYGFELIALNVLFYEWLKGKRVGRSISQ